MKPREQLLRALNRQRHVAPNGGGPDIADVHRAFDGNRPVRSDNIVRIGTVEELIEAWADEQLEPLDPRGRQTHGYECDCRRCRDCLPAHDAAALVLLCSVGVWVCVLAAAWAAWWRM